MSCVQFEFNLVHPQPQNDVKTTSQKQLRKTNFKTAQIQSQNIFSWRLIFSLNFDQCKVHIKHNMSVYPVSSDQLCIIKENKYWHHIWVWFRIFPVSLVCRILGSKHWNNYCRRLNAIQYARTLVSFYIKETVLFRVRTSKFCQFKN